VEQHWSCPQHKAGPHSPQPAVVNSLHEQNIIRANPTLACNLARHLQPVQLRPLVAKQRGYLTTEDSFLCREFLPCKGQILFRKTMVLTHLSDNLTAVLEELHHGVVEEAHEEIISSTWILHGGMWDNCNGEADLWL
jgi:hypothetical protein